MKHGCPDSVGGGKGNGGEKEKRAISCALTGFSGSDVTGRTVLVLSLSDKER